MVRGSVVLIAAVLGTALTARLGVWQLDRAAQKQALQLQLDQRALQPPLPMAELARTSSQATAQHDRHIELRGRWIASRTVFLENRQMDGRPGFFVLTPLEIGPGEAVVVQRGWAPRDLRDRTLLPSVPTPAGEVRVRGRIAPPPGKLYAFAPSPRERLRQNLDMADYASETGLSLRPLSVQQANEGAPQDGLLRRWPRPAVDVDKHHGYAFQWFALSLLLSALYVWFQLLAPWRRRARARAG